MKKAVLLSPLFAFSLILGASAAGSDSSGSTNPPKPTQTSTDCKNTEVWDSKKKKCVAADQSGFNDDQLYDAARELAYAGRAADARDILLLTKNQNTPHIQNYLGFTHRKLGDRDAAMTYYQKALSLNPDYVLARSYMGQAMIEIGDIDGAKAELREIRRRVGTQDYAYFALAQSLKTKSAY